MKEGFDRELECMIEAPYMIHSIKAVGKSLEFGCLSVVWRGIIAIESKDLKNIVLVGY